MGSQRGSKLSQVIRNDASSVNITTGAWLELDDSLDGDSNHIDVFNSTGEELRLAIGPAGSEQEVARIFTSGLDHQPLLLNEKMRLSVRAVSANATTGELIMNLKI